ncbi:type II secretory pathway predicted ATPase ExeA [Sinobacterium caligoides]|uniref:Type II secretory pathway predicted ATPase ExeA n=1 Tax=Sinobacterium caligoides TaxID=933926 RepID=A0A3N2E346_9GAMM|nr:AAA family ATPase [Sinobacterium caligoides]ROS06129.1 type II secretory pathway predicted ATPase ExeA [Sinobacterium caligoides]
MYRKHFSLIEKPFSLTPNPEFLYFSAKHRVAYSMLEYGLMEQSGITVITGDVGAGKTTLLRHLMNNYSSDDLVIGLVNNMYDGSGKLMEWVMMSFGLDHAAEGHIGLLRAFQNFVINNYANRKTTVIVVDEAQNLSDDSLEELRLLNNINSEGDDLLKVILVGQPELLGRLSSQSLIQLAQRVSVEYHLESLTASETVAYVQHRMKVAGGDEAVFDDSSIYAIYYLTNGVPRLINTLADYALLYAFSNDKSVVDVESILAVAKGRRIGGLNHAVDKKHDKESVMEFIEMTTGVNLGREMV